MDSNIPANPAYGVYISQLVRYARICTSKVDFINRLGGRSLRLRQQGFEEGREGVKWELGLALLWTGKMGLGFSQWEWDEQL